MNKDAQATHLHLHAARHADLFEDFCRAAALPADDIYVPPHHQPLNPEDEDDVVPDQHAAFGITRAMGAGGGAGGGGGGRSQHHHHGGGGGGGGAREEPAWRDFGLDALMRRGPAPAAGQAGGAAAAARFGQGRAGGGSKAGFPGGRSLPR